MQRHKNIRTRADIFPRKGVYTNAAQHLRGARSLDFTRDRSVTSEEAHESSYNLTDIGSLANQVAQKLTSGKIKNIGLTGPLGAGKTTFVRLLARALGYKGSVTSPTFTLMNEYQCPQNTLAHIDLYRADGSDRDMLEMVKESLASKRWVMIEWSDRLPAIANQLDIVLSFRHGKSENERIIEVRND